MQLVIHFSDEIPYPHGLPNQPKGEDDEYPKQDEEDQASKPIPEISGRVHCAPKRVKPRAATRGIRFPAIPSPWQWGEWKGSEMVEDRHRLEKQPIPGPGRL